MKTLNILTKFISLLQGAGGNKSTADLRSANRQNPSKRSTAPPSNAELDLEPVSDEQQILSDAAKFIPSTYLGWATALVTGFVTRKFLGPHLMGDWSYLQIIQKYGSLSHLGVLPASERDLSHCYGKEDFSRAATIRETSLLFALLTSLITFGGILAYAFLVRPNLETHYFIGLTVIAFFVLADQVGTYFVILHRSEKRFGIVSVGKILFALSWLVFSVPLVIFWSIYGIFVAALLQKAVVVGYYYINLRHGMRLRLVVPELRRLMAVGLPLLVLGMGIVTILNVDQVMIGSLLGSAELGYYSIAIMANNFVFSLPQAFAIVMIPRFHYRYGKSGDPATLEPFVRRPLLALSCMIPVFCGGIFLLFPPVVHWLLPRYVSGLAAMKILLVGTFFVSLSHMPNHFLIALDKQGKTARFLLVLIGIAIALNYLFIRLGMGIEGVAIGTAITYLLYYAGLLCYALRHYMNWQEVGQFFLRSLAPSIVVYCALFASDAVFQSLWPKIGVFAVISTLVVWHTHQQTRFISILWNAFRPGQEEISS